MAKLLIVFQKVVGSVCVAPNNCQRFGDFSSAAELQSSQVLWFVEWVLEVVFVIRAAKDCWHEAETELFDLIDWDDPILFKSCLARLLEVEHQPQIANIGSGQYVAVALGAVPIGTSAELHPVQAEHSGELY